MEVTLAVLADCANITREGKLNIMGVFGEINPPILPFNMSTVYMVIVFVANPSEVGSDKKLQIRLMDSDGKPILETEGRMEIPSPSRSGKPISIQSIVGFNDISFEKSGEYQFLILVNGEEKYQVNLTVNEPVIPIGEISE